MGTPAPPSLRRGESSHGCNRPFASVDETLTACCLRLGAASATCSCEPKSLSEVTQESWRGSISRFDVAPWTAVRNATESGKETVAALALGRSREGRIRTDGGFRFRPNRTVVRRSQPTATESYSKVTL